MSETVFLGRERQILEILRATWQQHVALIPQHSRAGLSFMSEAHIQVRYFVVRELASRGRPIEPETISVALHLPQAQVVTILDDLERKLFFLVRNQRGAVTWAYPVTVEPTPHRLSFSTGERLYGA